jgi:hypothetical protein
MKDSYLLRVDNKPLISLEKKKVKRILKDKLKAGKRKTNGNSN